MRSFLATTLLLCGLTLSCQTGPSQTEKDLLSELQSLRAERESENYLGKIKNAVEAWRKAMNAALAKYSEELAATRLESQQQITTMAGSLDGMARALIARKEGQDRFLAEIEKDRVQARKTLEEFKLEREATKIERDAIKLERDKVAALLEAAQRTRDEDKKRRRVDAEAQKELRTQLEQLIQATEQQSRALLSAIDKNRGGMKDLDLGLGVLERNLTADQEKTALARERSSQDQQDLEVRMDALAKITEESFSRLEKRLEQDRQERQDREREATARREAAKKAKTAALKKTALPPGEERGSENLWGQVEPFWQNPFIAIPSAFLLLVLLFFLLRRSPEEARMDHREEPAPQERAALETGTEQSQPAAQAGRTRAGDAHAPVNKTRPERRMPAPVPAEDASAADRSAAPAPTSRNPAPAAMPRPRCVSLRIPGDELTEGAEELLRERLARDPRILVEPRPRLERRGDGSLSARFYSVGGLAEIEVEALSRSLRSLVANR